MRLITVGLTGSIATGKSSVTEIWRAKGAAVIDTDELAHQTLEPGTSTHDAVLKAFGTVDRQCLGEIVFSNAARRQELNAIIHPAVLQRCRQQLATLAGKTEVAVVAIPLLFEVGVETEFDVTVAVGCSEQTQLARLAVKGLTEAQARARIGAQWPVQAKMDRARYAIWNDGSRAVLARQADILWKKFKEN